MGLNADPVAPPVEGYRLYNFGSEVASGRALPLLATLTQGAGAHPDAAGAVGSRWASWHGPR